MSHTKDNSPSIFIFDLDGTLTPSKSSLQPPMAKTLCQLLENNIVAVISGGQMSQFEKQFLGSFDCPVKKLSKLYLLPTSGAQFFSWDSQNQSWKEEYAHFFSSEEKEKIMNALHIVLDSTKVSLPAKTYGPQIEDRGTQISFSANGQDAPLSVKEPWDPDSKKRLQLIKELEAYIPEFELRTGGTNTIDITKKGIDKAFGIDQFFLKTGFPKENAIFFGDALFPGGNDYAAVRTGIRTVLVEGPDEAQKKLQQYI